MVTAHLCVRVPACALPMGQRDQPAGREGTAAVGAGGVARPCCTRLLQPQGALGGLEVQACLWPATPPPLLADAVRGVWGSASVHGFISPPEYGSAGQLSLLTWALRRQGAAFQGAPGRTGNAGRFAFSTLGEEWRLFLIKRVLCARVFRHRNTAFRRMYKIVFAFI